MKMHEDEIEINENIVKQLINEQFSQYKDLPIYKINSMGTVNAIYRLGDEYSVRLPRISWAVESLFREIQILPVIAKKVTLTIPEVIEKGEPTDKYPFNWAIYKWIEGDIYDNSIIDEVRAVEALARFVNELSSIQVSGNELKTGRKPLRELNEITIKALKESRNEIDAEKALKCWKELFKTEAWDGNPVWIHADLLKSNLLVNNGMLSAVIDFGSAGIGDPAFDITPAWTVLTSKTREVFKRLVKADDNAWLRAKAYALHQAALIIPYYRETNPDFVNQAKNTIDGML